MNVSLTPELEAFINEQVAAGLYSSASEVVRDGLRLLRGNNRERLITELNTFINEGLASAARGELYTPEEARELLLQKRQARQEKSNG